ncbi:hypothetical protein SRABI128_01321 [Microbacterium sp. Bi128]|nr:hypothetical protein SRABI128_01321 [Microbacterium sp. Bi128]
MQIVASRKIAATTANAARHPTCCPRRVPRGTPTTFAIVSPVSTKATPFARLPGPRASAATSAPMPKYAPCGRPARKREAATSSNVGAMTVSTVKNVSAAASAIITRCRGNRATDPAIVGAPTTTPSAYSDTSQPAWAIASSGDAAHAEGARSRAMLGSSPITTNSVMPIPKLPMARERSARIAAPLEVV